MRDDAASAVAWSYAPAGCNVVKPNQIHVLACSMFRHREKIRDAAKPARARETGSDVGERDRNDRIDFDRTFSHPVSLAHRDARPMPHANARRDFTRSDSVAKIFHEQHASESLIGMLAERFLQGADDLADRAFVAHSVDDVRHEVFV